MELKKKLDLILLVDDDHEDNLYHQIILGEMGCAHKIDTALNGIEALDYLKSGKQNPPDLIFLDINMPKMNGWEFLEQYKHLDIKQKARIVVMMLSTSSNPDDIERAKRLGELTGFQTKPLTPEPMKDIMKHHFPECF